MGGNTEGGRNKTHIAFSENEGKVFAGFFNEDTHRVVDIPYCQSHGQWYATLRKELLVCIKHYSVSLYNPQTGKGLLRFAAARCADNSIMLTLIITENKALKYEALLSSLKKSFKAVSIFYNVNN